MISRSSSYRRSRPNGGGIASTPDRFSPERETAIDLGLVSVPRKSELEAESAIPMLPVTDGTPKITKLLLKVNIERSLGPVNVVMSAEKTVSDLIKAAMEIYVKEKRRPLLAESDPKFFQLHYSQFTLESLSLDEKLMDLGSRNFFMCLRAADCCRKTEISGEGEVESQIQFSLAKIMDFLL